jgi:tRNA(fMet)-specific endonuclease VapC
MIVLDTNHLSELQRPHASRGVELAERLERQDDRPIATTIVTAEEQLRGRLATINKRSAGTEQVVPYKELIELLEFLAEWLILPFDPIAAQHFHDLRAAKIRVGTMDLKIAAIVLTHEGTLLSANLRDFRQVPSLSVEDWLAGA